MPQEEPALPAGVLDFPRPERPSVVSLDPPPPHLMPGRPQAMGALPARRPGPAPPPPSARRPRRALAPEPAVLCPLTPSPGGDRILSVWQPHLPRVLRVFRLNYERAARSAFSARDHTLAMGWCR